MATTVTNPFTSTIPLATMAKIGNQHRRMINTVTSTTMLLVWIDHLADGHSTTRLRSARRVGPRPLSFH